MPTKRKRGVDKLEEGERSPTPTSVSAPKKKKKELQYDPDEPSTSQGEDVDFAEIIQELFETIRNYKSDEGKLLCESFIRVPKRRTNPDYYEVVSQPMDMIKIQQKMKMDEYEEIDQLTADVELMVNNARAYYKKGSQEYIDATDLLDLYYEIRDELLVETMGDKDAVDDEDDDEGDVEETHENLDQLKSKIASIVQQESAKIKGLSSESEDDSGYDSDDFEQLFAALVNAQDGERKISEPFHLLPYKTLYPNYYDVILEPIDLKMIAKKVLDNEYRTPDDMDRDVTLLVNNAKTFNEPKSPIYKDACTLKKVFDAKKREIEQRKMTTKSSERTRGSSNNQKLSAQIAALEYPEPIDPTDFMEYESDSGAETVMSEEENPMWHLFNAVKNYTSAEGLRIIEPFLKLPSKRYYPDYYEEIERPISVNNIHKKIKTGFYSGLDNLMQDLTLVFENAKQYNADESVIYKNACLLQKVLREKKKELDKFGYKKSCDDDSSTKKKKSLTPSDADKKRGLQKKVFDADELLRKRLWSLYKSVHDYADNTGRLLRQIFMYLPSKKDYPDYYKVITDPIDLSTIEGKIKGNKYPSEYNLMSDFDLMFKNARHYNEEGSQVYSDAQTLEKALKAKWRILNQHAGTPKGSKSKTRKGPTPTSLAARLQDLYESIRDYQDVRGRTLSSPFMKVPAKADYPDYYEVIKRPMDMSTISSKMLQKKYDSIEDMVADFVQMFDNACKYNEPDSLIYKDALTLQCVCLEKKAELRDDFSNEVPDVRPSVQEMMTNLFIATYNSQDEEGRCYSDSFAELPDRDSGTDPNSVKPLTFDKIKRNLDRGRYRRMDRFQEDIFKVFERARAHSRSDSQLYEDAVEMQMFFIKRRDEICKNGEILLTPALSYTEKHLTTIIESEKYAKNVAEQHEDSIKPAEPEINTEVSQSQGDDENSLKYNDQVYHVGDFVYIEPRDSDSEPHILSVEKIYTDKSGQKQVYGNWFYHPNETFHLATRKFLQKEVLKSDVYASQDPSQILGKCYVMCVREYFKYKPEGFNDSDVYVCEFRYNSRLKSFKKIKIWSVPQNEEINLVEREVPLQPIRVASVFADRDKDEIDDGDTSVIDKEKMEVILGNGAPNEEGNILFEQMRTPTGMYKVGDSVYVKSDNDKPTIYRIDRMYVDRYSERYFYGPMFIRPGDIEHPPTRLFFKNEMFICGVEEARTMGSVTGRCAVLSVKDYCSCRPTEVPESDVYICESKYQEAEKLVRKLNKGLKKHSLSPRVTDDEIYFFRKHIIPQKEPSPLLVKVSEDSTCYDGEESRDTFTTDTLGDACDTSLDNFSFTSHSEVTPKATTKKGGDSESTTKKKVRSKRLPNGFVLYSAYIRRRIQEEEPEMKYSFGDLSRLVGVKWRNLEKEEKEKYEDKARKIAEEQQVKQEAAERAFNESLSKQQQQHQQQQQQQQWSEQQPGTPGQPPRPATPAQQGYPPGFAPGFNGTPGPYNGPYGAYCPSPGQYMPSPGGQFASMQPHQPGQFISPGGLRPGMMNSTPMTSRPPYPGPGPGQYQSPGGPGAPVRPGQPYPGMTPISYGQTPAPPHGAQMPHPGAQLGPYPGSPGLQSGLHAGQQALVSALHPGQQQMAPPPPPPRPPSPMFVTVPPRTQRLLHSEAYLKYIEGLNAESTTITEWEKTFTATPENTPTPDESRLPGHWLAQGAGHHGSVTDALWALRDLMLKDALSLQRTLPFEAL